jgi:hypothetical protein
MTFFFETRIIYGRIFLNYFYFVSTGKICHMKKDVGHDGNYVMAIIMGILVQKSTKTKMT